jgi:hypothetical protein
MCLSPTDPLQLAKKGATEEHEEHRIWKIKKQPNIAFHLLSKLFLDKEFLD